jgi:hypothetical protein
LVGQQFDPLPSQIDNLEIISPSSPQFESLVEKIVPDRIGRDVIRPALPYSVIIRNNGDRRVRAIVVRYSFFPSATKQEPAAGTLMQSYPKGQFARGAAELFTPAGAVRQVNRPSGPAYEVALRHLAEVRKSPSIRVSLDAIIFEDGELVGPDEADTFRYLVREGVQLRGLLREIQSMENQSDEVLLARLSSVSREPREFVGSHMIRDRLAAAEMLAKSLAKNGRQALNQLIAELLLNPPSPDVWKHSAQ